MPFGKKNVVSQDLADYSIMLMGESGIGKTTTMYKVCQKEFGDDGYILLNMGREDGVSAINGVVYEDVENWKKFAAIVNDIVKNKETDYPNLKVLVIDTLDQLLEITEPEVIAMWNRENLGKDGFVPAKTLAATWNGFGRDQDKVIQVVWDMIWKLRKVGVQVWFTAHTKTRELTDALTNMTFTTISSNMMQKYFNGFKTKISVCAMAVIDRTIETQGTGRKNLVTKKEIKVNHVVDERRKIVFRDDNYSVDSKSRFANIVDEIPLDADLFIEALHDALKAEAGENTETKPKKKATKKVAEVKSDPFPEEFENAVVDDVGEEQEFPENIAKEVAALFKACKDKELKAEIADTIHEYGKSIKDVPEEELKEMYIKLS